MAYHVSLLGSDSIMICDEKVGTVTLSVKISCSSKSMGFCPVLVGYLVSSDSTDMDLSGTCAIS